ncbi:diguanylate cyclase (GGDEF)-like protein [Pseudomonas sp. LP_7_YM]|nr:diguanylate cyclase (GGDEF)-like protein [Pseudomonas sp. LP_7_YM]
MKNGEIYPSWLTISAVRNRDRFITHFVAVFTNISSLKHAQAQLDYQAHHDPLTGLPNRTLFENRLQAALAHSTESQSVGAVLFLDLDRFKHINDSLGHPVGDLLLKGIAQRLKENLRDIDTVARLGGDEFIILLPGLQSGSDSKAIATTLLNSFSAPFQAGEHEFPSAPVSAPRCSPLTAPKSPRSSKTPMPRCTAPRQKAATASKVTPVISPPSQRAHRAGA